MSKPNACPKCSEPVPGAGACCPDCVVAQKLLTQSLQRLEREFSDAGRGSRFARLKPFLRDTQDDSYARAAVDLGVAEQAVRTAASRMRARFGKLIEDEIRENVGGLAG